MLENKIVLDSDVQILFQGNYSEENVDIAILPECFNARYSTAFFRQEAELMPKGLGEPHENTSAFESRYGETVEMLKDCSRSLSMYIIGGSIPERDPVTDKIYNTCLAFDRQGQLLGKHRKVTFCYFIFCEFFCLIYVLYVNYLVVSCLGSFI